jgi:hypothetical protein
LAGQPVVRAVKTAAAQVAAVGDRGIQQSKE